MGCDECLSPALPLLKLRCCHSLADLCCSFLIGEPKIKWSGTNITSARWSPLVGYSDPATSSTYAQLLLQQTHQSLCTCAFKSESGILTGWMFALEYCYNIRALLTSCLTSWEKTEWMSLLRDPLNICKCFFMESLVYSLIASLVSQIRV